MSEEKRIVPVPLAGLLDWYVRSCLKGWHLTHFDLLADSRMVELTLERGDTPPLEFAPVRTRST